MDWSRIPPSENVVEFAALVGEAEFVLDFGDDVQSVFVMRIFEDLRASGPATRFFARATGKDAAELQAVANGETPEEASAACLREAGVSLRRARGR